MREPFAEEPMKDKVIGLAPLAGVSDLSFRRLAFEGGADFAVTEMVSAKGLYYDNERTKDLMVTHPDEGRVILQLFGHEPEVMAQVIRDRINAREDFQAVDLNMGCPAPKIVKNGEGSALMKDPVLAGQVMAAMVRASKKPVTVKFRLGWDEEHINFLEIGRIAQEEGVASLTLHGRTREAMYSGKADWEAIAELKANVKIPVIGNGDVNSPETARAMLEQTACDGIAIGRGAMGHPLLFRQIKDYFEKGSYQTMDFDGVLNLIRRHYEMEICERGERGALLKMRTQLPSYLDGFYGAAKVRKRLNQAEKKEDVFDILTAYGESLAKGTRVPVER